MDGLGMVSLVLKDLANTLGDLITTTAYNLENGKSFHASVVRICLKYVAVRSRHKYQQFHILIIIPTVWC